MAHLSSPVSSSPPSINFFLLPHLLCFQIQYFPTLPAPKCTHAYLPSHTHTHILFSSYSFSHSCVLFSCLSLSVSLCLSRSQALTVCCRQSMSFPCLMSSSRLGDMLTFYSLSQVLPLHLFTNVSDVKTCPASPSSHRFFLCITNKLTCIGKTDTPSLMI